MTKETANRINSALAKWNPKGSFCVLREILPERLYYVGFQNGWKFTVKIWNDAVLVYPGLKKLKRRR